MLDYFIRVGDAFSQLVNVAFFGSKNPNESISGRAYSLSESSRVWYVVYKGINAIFFLQDNHCKQSYLNDIERARRLLSS